MASRLLLRVQLVTLHRPALVDTPLLRDAFRGLNEVAAQGLEVVFPVHPRTRAALDAAGPRRFELSEPLGYLDFNALAQAAR